ELVGGPEIEFWIQESGQVLYSRNDWSYLPFQALPDGAHASSEEFSYFTLLNKDAQESSSLFGLSCTRQIRADKLNNKSADVTRSFVQKAVVVIVDRPQILGQLRERLATVTTAWFKQEDFTNTDILKEFQASLLDDASSHKSDHDAYFGLSLRELLYELRWQTLVLVKCMLLQKKTLFFSTRCERLCLTQFALISLLPRLMQTLQDCAATELDNQVKTATRPTNLNTSDRNSVLAYMGVPLHVFGSDCFFSPYTPLQQLELLQASTTQSYIAGSTNTLFLAQNNHDTNYFADVLVNLDESSLASKVSILNPDLRSTLSLSAADRRWIDGLTQSVLDTWNSADPSRPSTYGFVGSEDAIRLSFEEYVLSLLSSEAYKIHFDNQPNPYLDIHKGSGVSDERYPTPLETSGDFGNDFLVVWRTSPNYKTWSASTDNAEIPLFNIIDPRHPTSGGLNIEDVQRRVGTAVADLHLEERYREGREQAGKAFDAGRERVGVGVARFWKEVDAFKERREQSLSRTRDRSSTPMSGEREKENTVPHPDVFDASWKSAEAPLAVKAQSEPAQPSTTTSWAASLRTRASKVQAPNVDATQIQTAARENAAKAGAYLGSWGSWARERSQQWRESGPEKQTASKS
ncbi:hypothetical protein LTR66_016416, partial [Elasticomyces elasticus]